MAIDWQAASDAIDAVYEDPEPIIYTGAGLSAKPVAAIRSEWAAPEFQGPANTLRTITYEVKKSALPQRPNKTNTFTHRGTLWRIENIAERSDISKWELTVTDGGPAS